jgi:hypothetical protein
MASEGTQSWRGMGRCLRLSNRLRAACGALRDASREPTMGGRLALVNNSYRQTSETAAVPEATTKSDTVLHLLRQPDGASLADLMSATSWQRHSVRGFLSGTVRKRLGLNLVSDTMGGGDRRYRIQTVVAAEASAPIEASVPNGLPSTTDAVDALTGTVVC